jgi:predicted DNA-binding transcriptional regulator YafY
MCGESRFDLVDLDFESGFVTIRNAEALNLVRALSTQEIMTILFGLDMLREDLETQRPDLLNEIEGLKALLQQKAAVAISATPAYDPKIQRTIDTAIQRRRALEIVYRSISHDEISERVVDPLEVFYRDNKLFLLAYCQNSQSRRTFRIDHIEKIELSENEITPGSIENQVEEKFSVRIRVHSNLRSAHETFGAVVAHALRRRIGHHQRGELALEFFQLALERVIFEIADLGPRAITVKFIVPPDVGGEGRDALGGGFGRHGRWAVLSAGSELRRPQSGASSNFRYQAQYV